MNDQAYIRRAVELEHELWPGEPDPDAAYDEHRQDCADLGICHFCEGEGCPRCVAETVSGRFWRGVGYGGAVAILFWALLFWLLS